MDTVMEKTEEKEFLENYEQKGWQLNPLIYKIIGASVVFHVVAIAVLSQVNLLQAKACDSPYVGKVCQVLDAVYVSSLFLGKDTAYVDGDVNVDELADADITYIDVSKMGPPFKYPEGYFANSNTEQQNTVLGPDGMPVTDNSNPFGNPSTATPAPSTDLLGTPQVTPTPNNKVQNQPMPNSPFDFGGPAPVTRTPKQPKVKQPKVKNDSPGKLPTLPGDDTVAQNGKDGKTSGTVEPKKKPTPATTPENTQTPDNTTATDIKIYKKPLADLLINVKGQVDAKTLNLLAPFSVTVDGVLTKDGKFDPDPRKTRYINAQGDQKMIDVAKSAIEAMNASGYFQYLKDLSDKRLQITLQQDQNNIVAIVKSEVATETEARRIASGLNFLISQGRIFRKGKDEAVLLEQAKVTNQGKVFTINFNIPQSIAQEMIQRKFKEEEEAAKKPQPNSVAGYKEAVSKG